MVLDYQMCGRRIIFRKIQTMGPSCVFCSIWERGGRVFSESEIRLIHFHMEKKNWNLQATEQSSGRWSDNAFWFNTGCHDPSQHD